jgi:hypothetical protein
MLNGCAGNKFSTGNHSARFEFILKVKIRRIDEKEGGYDIELSSANLLVAFFTICAYFS